MCRILFQTAYRGKQVRYRAACLGFGSEMRRRLNQKSVASGSSLLYFMPVWRRMRSLAALARLGYCEVDRCAWCSVQLPFNTS